MFRRFMSSLCRPLSHRIALTSNGLNVTQWKTGCEVDPETACNPPAGPLDTGDLTLYVGSDLDVMCVEKPFGRHDLPPPDQAFEGSVSGRGRLAPGEKLATSSI
jgi:hypothetical protein